MTDEQLRRGIDDLNFQVEKSLRYHQRRRGFYDGLHRFSMFAIILLGGGAVIDKPEVFGILASALAAVNLVWACRTALATTKCSSGDLAISP